MTPAAGQSGLLGDILSAALRAAAPAQTPLLDPQWIAGRALVSDLAEVTGLPFEALLDELTRVPDAMLGLLASPDGWRTLADSIAARLGAYPNNYSPTVH